MKLRAWYRSLTFYWQVYLVTVISFGVIIMIVEWGLEPVVEDMLEGWYGKDEDWHEVPLWIVSVGVPSLFVGSMLSSMVSRRLEGLEQATSRLARGDLGARIETDGTKDDVFDRLAANFNSMAESLEILIAGEKRLLADISHELRSPLTRLGVAAEILEKKGGKGDIAPTVAAVGREVELMSDLVEMLLLRGRERLAAAGEPEPLDLADILLDIGGHFSRLAEDGGKYVRLGIGEDLRILGTAGRLRSIFENLLENALFYSPPGGEIAFTAVREGDEAVVTVRDFGPGVPPEQLKNIFRAFFRADPSRARTSGGVGLGLTLAREAATAMGGTITAKNALPGLEVVVRLPFPDP